MRLWSFFKYAILCLRLGYYEHHGHIEKHEADRICWNYLDEL